jgi:hypothetical protein
MHRQGPWRLKSSPAIAGRRRAGDRCRHRRQNERFPQRQTLFFDSYSETVPCMPRATGRVVGFAPGREYAIMGAPETDSFQR